MSELKLRPLKVRPLRPRLFLQSARGFFWSLLETLKYPEREDSWLARGIGYLNGYSVARKACLQR